jgi:hypothetical protein
MTPLTTASRIEGGHATDPIVADVRACQSTMAMDISSAQPNLPGKIPFPSHLSIHILFDGTDLDKAVVSAHPHRAPFDEDRS